MALSASFDFQLNRNALITKAMLLLGVISAAQTPTDNEISSASNSLNLMLKAWQVDGMQLWRVVRESITPVTSRYEWTMGPAGNITTSAKPVEILEMYRRTTSTVVDVPLIRLTREEYGALSDKDQTGTPTSFYFEPQTGDQNKLYIWPAADSTFAGSNTLELVYQKPFDDMDNSTDTLAFPQEWELAVMYGLAVILAPEYGYPTTDLKMLISQAEKEKEKVMDWDTEHGSVFFGVEKQRA